MNRIITPLLLIALSLLAASCGSSRAPKQQLPAEIPADISLQTPQQRLTALCGSYAEWEDVQIPVRATLTSKNGLTCSGKAALKRGEWISISLRMLGFEVASVWIDRDSVHAVDRYHKIYLSESIAQVMGNAGVTLTDIQDILMGRAFIAGPQGGTLSDRLLPLVEADPDPDGLIITPLTQPAGLKYGFILSPSVNSVLAATVGLDDKYPVTVTYSGFVSTRFAGSFASVANIEFPARKISGSLQWDFASAKWNTGLTRSWSAPSSYRRIPASQLLQTISSF